jgi:hypothetical protein
MNLERPELTKEKGWVIVTDKSLYFFETFQEALSFSKVTRGHLMTKTYYESHYSTN